MIRAVTFVAVVIATLADPPNCFAVDLTGQATVIDGDTIEIHGQRIRLLGIDASKSRQHAKAALRKCGNRMMGCWGRGDPRSTIHF